MKNLILIKRQHTKHWVGDGFPVRSVFHYSDLAPELSPFLLMDYAGPAHFEPNKGPRRGVGEHPHRGFETVTLVYAGEVEHRDSSGGGGIIGPGDVQWMTAASGVVHEELHGPGFSKTGGPFEMVQLWVNLPARFKMAEPRYQGISNTQIPRVLLPGHAGELRLIAGQYEEASGAAKTYTPVQLWDLKVNAGREILLQVPVGQTASLFVLNGRIQTLSGEILGPADLAIFERQGQDLPFIALENATVLFLGGEPILEPIVGYGPFVMNQRSEIQQALADYQSGLMGSLKITQTGS